MQLMQQCMQQVAGKQVHMRGYTTGQARTTRAHLEH